MAYSFDSLSKKIDDDEKNKQNIFAGEQQGFGLTDTQNAAASANKAVEKSGSTTIQDVGTVAPSTSASQPASPVKSEPRGATEQRQKSLNRQAENVKIPETLSNLSSGIEAREQELQNASQDYLNKYRQQDFGLDENTVQQATQGNRESLDKVSGLLSRGTPGVIPDQFEIPEVTTPGVSAIQTDGGLEQYLRRQAGPQYTAGEGAFDVSALSRSSGFQDARNELGRREDALTSRADELGAGIGIDAQNILNQNLGMAQTDVRKGLGDIQYTLEDLIEAQRQAKIQEMADYNASRGDIAAAEGDRYRDELLDQLSPEDSGLATYLQSDLNVDPSSFLAEYQAPVARENVVTPEQAYQWNIIADLLGGGGEALTPTAIGETPAFDASAYRNALLAAARTAREQDVPPVVYPGERSFAENRMLEPMPQAPGTPQQAPVTSLALPAIQEAAPVAQQILQAPPAAPPVQTEDFNNIYYNPGYGFNTLNGYLG